MLTKHLTSLWKRISASEYSRNVLTLGSGTVVSGLIPVIGALVLMKLYDPDSYGVLAVFSSAYFVLSVVSTGRYEYAIVLPKEEWKAKCLTIIAITSSFVVCGICTLLLLPFRTSIGDLFNLSGLGNAIFLVPLTAFLFAGIQSLFYYANRLKPYGLMARAKVTNNAVQVGSQIGMGFLMLPFNGLVAGNIIGRVAGLLSYGALLRRLTGFRIGRKDMVAVAREYSHFPRHLTVSYGLSAFYQQIPIFFVTAHYAASEAGQLAIATQLVAVPNALIANAIGDVFRQRAAHDFQQHGHFRGILVRTLVTTFLLALVPFLLLVFFAPAVFAWYDQTWAEAGLYTAILGVALFFSFVITPVDKALLIVERTRWMLYWHTGFFIGHLVIILPVALGALGIVNYLVLLAALRVVAYLAMAVLSYRVSGGRV